MPYRDDDAPKCDGPADGMWKRLIAKHWWIEMLAEVAIEWGVVMLSFVVVFALSGNDCLCHGGGREPWRTER